MCACSAPNISKGQILPTLERNRLFGKVNGKIDQNFRIILSLNLRRKSLDHSFH